MSLRLLILLIFGIALGWQSHAADVTLHLIPAPTRTNWSSPQKLASSALKNQIVKHKGLKRHSIGHLFIELNCGSGHFFTGSTSTGDTEERKALFLEGYGLGVVLKNFQGKLDPSDEAEQDIRSQQAAGRSNFVKFLISESTCNRLMDYWFEYQRRGYHRIYAGLNARPLYGESAGCTAFGASFLEIAGLLHGEFTNQWKTQVIMPRKFVGGPITKKKVNFLKVLTAFHSNWDRDLGQGGIMLDFWDPEKMVEWTDRAVKSLIAGQSLSVPWPATPVRLDNSVGVEFDATDVATPTGPYFLLN